MCLLVLVGESRKIVLVTDAVGREILVGERHQQHVAIVETARTTQMRLRKTIDSVITIVIAATTIPTILSGVGTWLNHSKWHDGTRIGMAVPIGADKRIDV